MCEGDGMEEWKECKLEQVCENIYSGGTPATMVKEYWNGNLPWLSSGETGQRYIYSTEKTITQLGVDNSSTRYAYKNSTVVASAGQGYTRGQASFLTIDTYVNQSVIVLKPNIKLIDPKYLYFNIDNRYAELRQLSDGTSTRGSLSGKIMKDLSIKLPPLPTQQKIADILSYLDDKIELNNKINTNLEQQAQALFKNWFVDFEPFGGKMPEGWKEAEFRDVCENITDGVHNTVVDDPNGEYLLLSCKNIKGGVLTISSSERKINKETFEKLRKRTKLAKGDILLSSVGTVGEMYLLNETPDNYEFQRSVAIIKPNTSLISPAFLYESMLSQKDTIIHSAHGAVQQCIFISDVGDFTTILPTIDIIEKFTKIVQPMLDTITANQHENRKLSNMRDTLLPKLMNGEFEV